MSRWVTGGDVWEVTGDFGELEVIGDLGGRSFWKPWGGRPPWAGSEGMEGGGWTPRSDGDAERPGELRTLAAAGGERGTRVGCACV